MINVQAYRRSAQADAFVDRVAKVLSVLCSAFIVSRKAWQFADPGNHQLTSNNKIKSLLHLVGSKENVREAKVEFRSKDWQANPADFLSGGRQLNGGIRPVR